MPEHTSNVVEHVAERLAALAPGFPQVRLCVAFSGGVDSLVLLHATREVALHHAGLGLRVAHVDHGLQAGSSGWAERCGELCERLAVPFDLVALQLSIEQGASVEAEARRERYAALAGLLQPGECLLTAHHADDQLETVLLQLFRGAGVAGLAAMPEAAPLGDGLHLRPLLAVPRAELVAYATALGLDWVEDPMNRETRYDRAYLRQHVLPAIEARWPSVTRTIGRSARHFAEAQRLLEALAEADGARLLDEAGRIEVLGLKALPRERQVNVLRWWIVRQGLGLPSTVRLESILSDVVPARPDAHPVVTWPTGEIRRRRGRLCAGRAGPRG